MKGFTLIELLVVLTIAGIVAVFGIPSMTQMVQDNRLTGAVDRFAASLRYARSEAIKRNATITVDSTGPTATDWEDGWQIFEDVSGQGNATYNSTDDDLIRVEQAIEGTIAIRGDESTAGFLSYTGEGRPVSGAVSIFVCDERGSAEGISLSIGLTGRISKGGISGDSCTP